MLQTLAAITGLLASAAWLSALVHALLLLPHRRDDVSLGALAVQGYRFYRQDTWKPAGHALHARFVRSTLAFFGLVVAAALLAVLGR